MISTALIFSLLAASSADVTDARKMVEQLRYEEAVVEYQRALTASDRSTAERAQLLLELGFVHLVLGDSASAEARALEGLELDPQARPPEHAPSKLIDFVAQMRKRFQARARLELVPREDGATASQVVVKLADPESKVRRVLLRHALTSNGPYFSAELRCEAGTCRGSIPTPRDVPSFTAWYFVEALDAQQATIARVASPEAPLQLAVVDSKPWYTSPVVWGVSGAVLVAAAAVVFVLAPAPPR